MDRIAGTISSRIGSVIYMLIKCNGLIDTNEQDVNDF